LVVIFGRQVNDIVVGGVNVEWNSVEWNVGDQDVIIEEQRRLRLVVIWEEGRDVARGRQDLALGGRNAVPGGRRGGHQCLVIVAEHPTYSGVVSQVYCYICPASWKPRLRGLCLWLSGGWCSLVRWVCWMLVIIVRNVFFFIKLDVPFIVF